MMNTFASAVLAATFTIGLIQTASAQQVMRRVQEPSPIDANDPLAVRTASVVKHILAGEKDLALAALRKEADGEYANGQRPEQDVDAQIKRLAAGKYRIQSYEAGFGTDVVVFLTNDKAEDANLVVRYSADRKITGFAVAKIQRD
jgi:hypothetical protein